MMAVVVVVVVVVRVLTSGPLERQAEHPSPIQPVAPLLAWSFIGDQPGFRHVSGTRSALRRGALTTRADELSHRISDHLDAKEILTMGRYGSL